MAFSIKKYNRGNGKFNVNTSGLEYKKLKELWMDECAARDAGKPITPGEFVYVIGSVFVNPKSKLGESCAAVVMDVIAETGEVTPVFIASLPQYCVDDIKSMIADDEAVEAIKNYHVGFRIREYVTKTYNTTAYAPEWVDVNDD